MLLTAVLLKVVLEVVLEVVPRGRSSSSSSWWLVLGDAASLGGFWPVTGLILVLMAARWGVRRLIA